MTRSLPAAAVPIGAVELDAVTKRLDAALAALARVSALADTWTEWGDLIASDMLRDALEGKPS